jgi:hypothetical protein
VSHNIGEPFKQAERLSSDGAVRVSRSGERHLAIEVTNDGNTESVLLSDFNASRVMAMLSLMLGVKLVKGQRILL